MGHLRSVAESVLTLLFLALSTTSTFALEVTTCGQVVGNGETGILAGNLTCPSDVARGVQLEGRATLDLAGHTLSGASLAVFCRDTCFIYGPGAISDAVEGITVGPIARRVEIENLTLSGHRSSAVETDNPRARVILRNVTLTRNNLDPYLRAAVNGLKITAENVTATQNARYVFSGRVKGSGLILDGNGGGIQGLRAIRLENSSIANSTGYAILGVRSVRLDNVILEDNDVAGSGIDLLTAKKPRLENTSCSRSQACERTLYLECIPQSATWDVCTND